MEINREDNMILIGIDPSFSGTGITAEYNGKVFFQGEMSSKRNPKQTYYTNKLLIDHCDMLPPTLIHEDSEIDDGDIFRLIEYQTNLTHIFYSFANFIHSIQPDKTQDWHFCIEIPMGVHAGAGAKVDRCYAAVIFAIKYGTDIMNHSPINLHAVLPRAVKKYIIGNANAKKDKVQEQLIQKFGYTTNYPKNFNLSDSYAIMLYMKHLIKNDPQHS